MSRVYKKKYMVSTAYNFKAGFTFFGPFDDWFGAERWAMKNIRGERFMIDEMNVPGEDQL